MLRSGGGRELAAAVKPDHSEGQEAADTDGRGLGEMGVAYLPEDLHAADRDDAIRAAAFACVEAMVVKLGTTVPWSVIDRGFSFAGEKICLASQAEGIFKPRQMSSVLSIKTTIPRAGRASRYEDQSYGGGVVLDATGIIYDFKGENPLDRQNKLLHEAGARKIPLIYFFGIKPSIYEIVAPVFVEEWDGQLRKVRLTSGVRGLHPTSILFPESLDERRYGSRLVSQRLHQKLFRERVLDAYRARCALSRLRLPQLVDAAHIIRDSDETLGQPIVQNGICMSKLHHTAFDQGLIAIDQDYRAHIAECVASVDDGPLIEHLRAIDGRKICLPRERSLWPDPDRLKQRYLDTVRKW